MCWNGTEHTWVGVCSISGHQTVRRITEALTATPSPEDALPKERFAGRALGQVCNSCVSWEQHRRNTVSMDVRQTWSEDDSRSMFTLFWSSYSPSCCTPFLLGPRGEAPRKRPAEKQDVWNSPGFDQSREGSSFNTFPQNGGKDFLTKVAFRIKVWKTSKTNPMAT